MDKIVGKFSIVTGGGSGIGAAIVNQLFKSGLIKGCTIADKDDIGETVAKEMNCRFGRGKAIFIEADLSNPNEFRCVFEEHLQTFKHLDILINNAAILNDQTWEKMIDINISGTVTGTLLGIEYMGKNNCGRGGTIINMSSTSGLRELAGFPCYAGTRHFVIGLTRSFGTDYWHNLTGINFLTMCPSLTSTPMLDNANCLLNGIPELDSFALNELQKFPTQSAEEVAESLNTVINDGENGSIWVKIRDRSVFQIKIPCIHDMKRCKEYLV